MAGRGLPAIPDVRRSNAGLPGRRRIGAAYRAKHCLDVTTGMTQATPNYWSSVAPGFTGQAGSNVIVGDVDSGIDWSHAVIYDGQGRRVRTLVDAWQEGAHWYEPRWDGRDERGDRSAAGTSFAALRTGGRELTHRLVMVK